MNKGGAITVAALFLAAMVGVTYLPRSGPDSKADNQKQEGMSSQRAGSGKPGTPKLSEPCKHIAGQLTRLFQTEPPTPDSCDELASTQPALSNTQSAPKAEPKKVSSPSGKDSSATMPALEFVIAILPHPLQTHLPLFFDRGVEAIEQAAQDEGYSYDSSWFPWNEGEREYTYLLDDIANRELKSITEKQPGVMVFRQGVGPAAEPYKKGLVVFLVGEQPTKGIDDNEFKNALAWVAALDPSSKQPLRILGPTTSGALPSLALGLQNNPKPWQGRPQLQVFSGTVSSATSFDWFCHNLETMVSIKSGSPGCSGKASEKVTGPKPPVASFEFRTYQESDELMIARFSQYLIHEGYDIRRLAFLSEDETAFGGDRDQSPAQGEGNKKDAGKPIYLYYPRDIAALRSAYERQSIFTAGRQSSASSPSTTLRGDLSEPTSGSYDAARSYAGDLDPLAQESILLGIIDQLRSHQIQFVLVRSSNTLDQVFLSQFLRRSYPEARIVLDGADLLFTRGGQGTSLRGVMVLSTYPLLPMQQEWTHTLRAKHNGSFRVFGQDSAEAIYIAFRELIGQDTAGSVPIHDYFPPRLAPIPESDRKATPESRPTDQMHPPTWLTVIGHRRFWPVAVLNESTTATKKPASPPTWLTVIAHLRFWPVAVPNESTTATKEPTSLLTPASAKDANSGDDPASDDSSPGAHVRFPMQMKILLATCLALALWHLYCCWYGSWKGPLAPLAYFAPLQQTQYQALVFLGCFFVGMVGVVLAVVAGLSNWAVMTHDLMHKMLWVTAFVLLAALLSCIGNFSLPRLQTLEAGQKAAPEDQYLWKGFRARFRKARPSILGSLVLLITLLGLYGLVLHFYLLGDLNEANRLPAFWRSVNIFSGVSPLLPQILLLFGLYGWFWFSLSGMALLGADRPRLPRKNDLNPFLIGFSYDEAQAPVEGAAMPLGGCWPWLLIIFLILAGAVFRFSLPGWGVRSLGEMRFGYLVFWWLALMIALILGDTWQLFTTWTHLRGLLVLLDRLRLRRTLAAMKGISWGSVWRMGGNVLEERYRVLSRQLESLRNLHNVLEKWDKATDCDLDDRKAAMDATSACLACGTEFAKWYVGLVDVKLVSDIGPMCRFQTSVAQTAAVMVNRILLKQWQYETGSLLFDKALIQSPKPAKEDDKEHPFAPSENISDQVRAAEEFFVLPYLAFIQNTLGRIRTMVFGLLVLFVAVTLAVSSYPFDPLPALGGVFLTLFVLVGAVVIIVYAGMNRDATLSYVTNTKPGELGLPFWGQLLTFGAGPLLALLTTLFPSLTDFLFTWLQPSTAALK